jgi:diguanylate cyclase (GGDEF)-like protein/PAS domain S-box-containing protein
MRAPDAVRARRTEDERAPPAPAAPARGVALSAVSKILPRARAALLLAVAGLLLACGIVVAVAFDLGDLRELMAGAALALAIAIGGIVILGLRPIVARDDATGNAEADAAAEKKRYLDAAIENMSIGLCMFDAEQRLIVCNKRYADLYDLSEQQTRPGMTLREILEHRIANGNSAIDYDSYLKGRIDEVTANKPYQITNRLRDGRYISVVHRPMSDGGWVATHEDVTEIKRREESFRLLFEGNPIPMWVFERDSLRFLAVNEAAIALYGYTREQFLSMTVPDLRPAEDRERFAQFLRSLADVQLSENIGQHLKPDGSVIDIAVFSSGLTYEGHEARLSAVYDITQVKQAERELRRTQKFLDAVVEHVPLPIAVKSITTLADGTYGIRFSFFNRAYEEVTGDPRELMIGKTPHDLFPKARADLIVKTDNEALNSPEAVSVQEHEIVTALNGIRKVTARKIAIRDNDGKPQYLLSLLDDVTERRDAERRIAQTERFLNTIIENAPVPIVVKDPVSFKHVLINRAYEQFSGCPRERMIGKTIFDIFSIRHAELVTKHDIEAMQRGHGPIIAEFEVETPGKGARIVATTRLVVRDSNDNPQHLIVVIEDVTERRHADARISYLALHDALTGLPNRTQFNNELEKAMKRARRGEQFALFCLDLDNFKSINDSLGHPVGDQLLKAVAKRLRECVRDSDLITRMGGDEFAILQGAIDGTEEIVALIERIKEVILVPYNLDGHQVNVNLSIGIALAPRDSLHPDELLKYADIALYEAKKGGRGTFSFFDREMNERIRAQRQLEGDLHSALANDEFELHYQPIVDLQSRSVNCVEALIRWRHPQRGLVLPKEFIPVAETTGLIVPLGEWILRRACADAVRLPEGIRVAVNLSAAQFMGGGLVALIVNALAAASLPADRLELEITEAVMLDNDEATREALHQLRALGVRIVMDDFGTGYSSLSYLHSFPFDKIKIDRSFIAGLASRDDEAAAIVRAITGLARSLNMTTTAEGVETEHQLELVKAFGCTEIQGYLIARPMPLAELTETPPSGAMRKVCAA